MDHFLEGYFRGRHARPREEDEECEEACLECRVAALEAAVAALGTSGGGGAQPGIPAKINLTPGRAWNQNEEFAVQIQDNEQYVITVAAVDAKGVAVADTLNYSIDNQAVAVLEVAADGQSVTVKAVAPGTANVTVTDAAGLSATEVVTVVAGPVVALHLTDGAAAPQV